ncbi:uncharacterized protein LAESUDRAFT_727638 [Laetiporus sulphureus 93-53]|uniref:Uncharacterized protein n=1 Tax=Laetiporus sulphureus 93-53 TaxID=1314785 RepID=A0A165DFH5_9APHY|nr:uncharacterized protein LAESUDRAFT_727638 [Laetiporus sulphureus 93-53]KZT04781.1 hypothetical protein LAESUDRAFT_727638 [Laetiporus sulphureus 93-53]
MSAAFRHIFCMLLLVSVSLAAPASPRDVNGRDIFVLAKTKTVAVQKCETEHGIYVVNYAEDDLEELEKVKKPEVDHNV